MRKNILLFIILSVSINCQSQIAVRDTVEIEKLIKFYDFPASISIVELTYYPCDINTIKTHFNMSSSNSRFYRLKCKFFDIPINDLTWYTIEDSIFINKNSFMLLDKLIESKCKAINPEFLKSQLVELGTGLNKITFLSSSTGVYNDKTYKKKKVPFNLSFNLLTDEDGTPQIHYINKSTYINLSRMKNELSDPSVGIMLLFNSVPEDGEHKINQIRHVYFSLSDTKLRSSEIESKWFNHQIDFIGK